MNNEKIMNMRKENQIKLKEIESQHYLIAEYLKKHLQEKGGFNIEMKTENELMDKDVLGKDLLISLGGDNTFLKS